MLPDVSLRVVTRADVARIGRWLKDEEVSDRWFGHYACGDPVHRGYDPDRILTAPESEWDRVFRLDAHRFICSVYDEHDRHIGESQLLLDDKGGAEISLLIGRKDLWRRGYGTSAVMSLLERVFSYYLLDRAWVNVPEDNAPALGLFKKLGFGHRETRQLGKRADGTSLNACILSMSAGEFIAIGQRENERDPIPVVTITGLPGSGSEVIGSEIARIAGVRFVDAGIRDEMCRRLRCSIGELEAFEANCGSRIGRFVNAFQSPWERYSAYDGVYDGFGHRPIFEPHELREYVTGERYLEALKGAITGFARGRAVVLHGHGSHLFVPADVPALHVFVSVPKPLRRQRIAAERELSPEKAARWLQKAEREGVAVFKHVVRADPLDVSRYDLILNSERLSFVRAAQTVAGALESMAQDPVLGRIARASGEHPLV